MSNEPNINNNAAGAQGTGNNPEKCFAVTVGRTDYRTWNSYVIAATEEEAELIAMKLAETLSDEDWTAGDHDLLALDVRQVQGGQGHE